MSIPRRARRQARRLYRACLVDGVLDRDRALQAIDAIAEARLYAGRAVLAAFLRLSRLEHERCRAVVESAVPLPPDLRDRLEMDIARAYCPGLQLTFAQNAALIGGIRVRVGSDVWDGSVRGALRDLETAL
jgi:F-type H+-transporting ATPase subunit delta